jgi:hypothetical protein
MEIIFKWIIALFTIVLLRTIKSYFLLDNAKFKKLLLNKGFHPLIANYPHIIFNYNRSRFVIYLHFWARFVLSAFSFSIRHRCWRNCNTPVLLKRIGWTEPYIENVRWMNLPYSIKVPINEAVDGKRIAIYSVMVGDYDNILDPVYISDNCDYILYTDNANIKSEIWQIKLIEKTENYSDKWYSRYYKMFAHKVLDEYYDCSIYVDAKVLIWGDIVQLINYLNKDCLFAMIKHHLRFCLKQEIEYCIEKGKTSETEAKKQYRNYINEGFPDNLGLVDCCVLIRNHNEVKVQKVMETWFDEFTKYPMRDQFSIMYSLWKNNMKEYCIIEGLVYNNQFVIEKKHRHQAGRILKKIQKVDVHKNNLHV